MYHHGWAWALDTPFRSTKLVAAHFGGTRTPRPQFHHVVDVAPTIYDVPGIEPPTHVNGVEQTALGRHVRPSGLEPRRRRLGALRSGGGLRTGPRPGRAAARPAPGDAGHVHDPGGAQQSAADRRRPLHGGVPPEEARASTLTEWTLFQGQSRIAESLAPKFTSGFSTLATMEVDVPESASGVLYCVGGIGGGFTAYMDANQLKAEYNMLGLWRYKAASEKPIPAGRHAIEVEVLYDGRAPQGPATISLRADGKTVGTGRIERSVQSGFTASETFDVGVDLGSPVALDYHDRAPFAFNGTIERLHVKYIPSKQSTRARVEAAAAKVTRTRRRTRAATASG